MNAYQLLITEFIKTSVNITDDEDAIATNEALIELLYEIKKGN